MGPIPPGIYFIVDRESGGMLGGLRDYFTGRDTWFALCANDNRIDDKTFCNNIIRGHFRLHPKGVRGVSEGCVVIDDAHNSHPCGRSSRAAFFDRYRGPISRLMES